MHVTFSLAGSKPARVPETLLAHNMEMTGAAGPGLSPNRLANPRFAGPAHPINGIARAWEPGPSHNHPGMLYALVPGMGIQGGDAQMIRNCSGHKRGIVQPGIKVQKGERLEVLLWARTQFQPCRVRLELQNRTAARRGCASAHVDVTRPYWHPVQAMLEAPMDDDDAVFAVFLPDEGTLWLAHAMLRPIGSDFVRHDLLYKFATLRIPALRFPGGCVSTAYHWRHGIGPQHLRPAVCDPVFRFPEGMDYTFGTDEYLDLCQKQNITPHITVNLCSPPEEAAEWAGYAANWFRTRGLPVPLMYWQIGNEHNTGHEIGHMTPQMYAQVLRTFAPKIRAACPQARIIALGYQKAEHAKAGSNVPWRAAILNELNELADLVSIHCYSGGYSTDPGEQQRLTTSAVGSTAQALDQALEDLAASGGKLRLAVTEWNLWQYAAHHDGRDFYEPYDLTHCLFTAGMFHEFFRRAPGMELANFYNLLNPMGIYRVYGPEIQESPLAGVFRLYREALPGDLLPLCSNAPKLAGTECAAVDGICLQTTQARWLFVINRDAQQDATVEFSADLSRASAMLLTSAKLTDFPVPAEVELSGNQVRLPSKSIVRVRLRNSQGA